MTQNNHKWIANTICLSGGRIQDTLQNVRWRRDQKKVHNYGTSAIYNYENRTVIPIFFISYLIFSSTYYVTS